MSSSGERSASSRPSSSGSRSGSLSSKLNPVEEIKDKEYNAFLIDCLTSHAGYLRQPILSLATSTELSILHTAMILAGLYFCFLLVSPSFLLPHLSALITLIIPLQCTLQSIALDQAKTAKKADHAVQWCFYWVIYCLLEVSRGWVGIFRPGLKAMFEVIRTVALITVGGPWFGKAALRPGPPSEALTRAERVEAAKEVEKKKAEAKNQTERKKNR